MTLNLIAARNPDSDTTTRTIGGLVLPYNTPGFTNAGAVTVSPGSISLPDDISRIKLLRGHSNEREWTPVGYATDVEDTPDGIRMKFKIGATADGDVALSDVTEHIRDALSVELIDTNVNGGTLTAGTLVAVALVPIPAFADARVDLVTASFDTTGHDSHEHEESEDAETSEHAKEDEADEENADVEHDDSDDADATKKEGTKMPKAITAARVPHGVHGKPDALTFSRAVEAFTDLAVGRPLTAALADITDGSNLGVQPPHWLGELWSGVAYEREIVPTMTQKPLTSMRMQAWRFKNRPEVSDYDGNKTEIPTNEVTTEPVGVVAKRLAAGWDFDRAFIDFNDQEFIRAFFEAAREDYALKSDQRAASAVIDYAAQSTLTPTAQPDLLHAAAHARQLIKTAVNSEPSTFLVHPDDMFGLFDITMLDIPQFLQLLGVEPAKFRSSPLAKKGTVVAYAQPAVTWYELSGSPIRVSAQHISHGGWDEAVFGYYASSLNDPRGIVQVQIGAGDTPSSEAASSVTTE